MSGAVAGSRDHAPLDPERPLPAGRRVALVHDWLTGMRGGEKVLERLCGLFPEATIHTLLWNRGSVSPAIEAHPIRTSFLQRMPGIARHYRWYLPWFPRAVESLDLGDVDLVISTSHAVAKGARAPRGALHVSYVFTPMRYVWEMESQYFPPDRFRWPLNGYVRSVCSAMRHWDMQTGGRPDVTIAISNHVAGRVARHWGRTSEVIPPPVDVARFPVPTPGAARDFYLVAGALAPYKRADLAVTACRRLGRRLIVVGSGEREAALRLLAGRGVEFRGWVSDEEMVSLYAGARGLLFPGEEDFGIVPVEALASGCPVVAFGRGGAVETVAPGVTTDELMRIEAGDCAVVAGGVLFGTQTPDGLGAAIERLEANTFDPLALRELASPFSGDVFERRFMSALRRHYAGWRARSVTSA